MLRKLWRWLTWCDECASQRERAEFWRESYQCATQQLRARDGVIRYLRGDRKLRRALDRELERRRKEHNKV